MEETSKETATVKEILKGAEPALENADKEQGEGKREREDDDSEEERGAKSRRGTQPSATTKDYGLDERHPLRSFDCVGLLPLLLAAKRQLTLHLLQEDEG